MRFPYAPWNMNKEERQSSLSEPNQDLLMALGGEMVTSGERISIDGSLRIADVFTAVSIITGTIATLPLKIFREVGENVEEQPLHRAARMLGAQPNPAMPAHAFWPILAGHLLLWGNAFVEKLRDEDGLVAELWPLHPGYVEVEWNAQLRQKRYTVWDGANKRVLSADRVLHMFGYSVDGLVGLSPIQQAKQSLGVVKARERFEGELYHNKPFVTGVIETDKRITDTVKIRESWAAIYGGGDKGVGIRSGRHSVAVLEEGAHYNQLTAPLADMQFVESTQMSKAAIASLFKLPPAYLGGSIGDSLTYQTVESNQIQFARMAITPVTVNMQKFLGADTGLFPFQSWYPEFVLEGLLRGDSKARAEFYAAMVGIGALTPNEVRGLENYPPLPGGDEMPTITSANTPTIGADAQD